MGASAIGTRLSSYPVGNTYTGGGGGTVTTGAGREDSFVRGGGNAFTRFASGTRAVADAPATARTDSKYWNGAKKREVTIDGYGFDFIPKENVGQEKVKGEVDGPLSHNGRYEILENDGAAQRFAMRMNAGSDDAQKGDLDVTIKVAGGKATVTGKVKGKDLGPDGVSAPITGTGTKRDPFKLSFKDGDGKAHTIQWAN